jgi:hypothetical protein
MMNDRFSAELRRHLLEAANERPAPGQLAAIVEGVATTRQRHPLVARLTFTPGRIGPLPSAVFRYGLLAAALIGAALAGALIGAGAGPSRGTVLEGTWTTTDPFDGSGMVLVVAPGTRPAVYFEDAYATGEACFETSSKRFTAYGIGTVFDDRLEIEWPDGGGCGGVVVGMGDGSYRYDPRTDSLLDGDGLTWTRMDGADGPPTQPPRTEPPAPTPPLPDPTPERTTAVSQHVDLAHGGTYTAPIGPLSATATVPDAPLIAWQGWPDWFELSNQPRSGARITLGAFTKTSVLATSCMPDAPEITSFADAVARLDTPRGDDIAPRVDLVIDGHSAATYDVVDLSSCPGGFGLWDGTILGPGETGSVYVIDVDGLLIAIELNRDGSQTPDELEEAYAIVASLQFADGDATD